MTSTEPVWKEISWYSTPSFEDEQAFGCYLTKVFCYHTDRNAWWSTPTGEIRGYSLNRKSLEDKIERERTQGTRFNISELPAIALMGKLHDLLIFEFSQTPLKEAQGVAVSGSTLQSLCNSVRASAPYTFSYKTYLAPRGRPPVPILPYKAYESFPQGAGYRLGWSALARRTPDITHVASLVNRICLHLNGQG